MSSTTERSEEAVACFTQGCNCAQAVSSVFARDAGVPEEVVLRAATGFGGGVAHTGGACGAVSGAVLAIGLLFGSTGPEEKEAKDRTYALTQEFIVRFVGKHGTVSCTGLLDCDLSTEEGLARARSQGITRTLCPGYVRDAVEILEEML